MRVVSYRFFVVAVFIGLSQGCSSAGADAVDELNNHTDSAGESDSRIEIQYDSDSTVITGPESNVISGTDSVGDNAIEPLRIEAECAFGADKGDCGGAFEGTNSDLPGKDGADTIPLLKAGEHVVGYFYAASWLAFPDVDLTGYTSVSAAVASDHGGGTFEVRLDSVDGALVATIQIPDTGSWESFQISKTDLSPITGVHTVYLVSPGNDTYNGDVDWIEFTADAAPDSDTVPDTASDTVVDTNPVFHIFLLLGQSNMAGFPKAQEADRVENERIKVLGFDNCASTGRIENQWATASPPLHECWNGAIGPGDHFAKTMIGHYKNGDTIGLVPCAISGEKIETFMKGVGTKYDWIVDRAKLAQQAGGVIDGILFHQGESNNTDPNWPGNVSTLVEDLRADLGLGDIPFLAGELLIGGGCEDHNLQVNRLPEFIDNAHVISSNGLLVDPVDTYNLHFGHDAQVELGKRYAAEMIKDLGL